MNTFTQLMRCPYCNDSVSIRDAIVVYKRSGFGSVWICNSYPTCDSYVGAHNKDLTPKGTLANKELREARKKAHAAFDPIWQSGRVERDKAYEWLSEQLGLPREETHMGMFDIDMCNRVIEICTT